MSAFHQKALSYKGMAKGQMANFSIMKTNNSRIFSLTRSNRRARDKGLGLLCGSEYRDLYIFKPLGLNSVESMKPYWKMYPSRS